MAVQIYAFFYCEAKEKRYFYVGRSKDIARRMREHQHSKEKGHEDKYERIRRLESAGTPGILRLLRALRMTTISPMLSVGTSFG